MTTFEHAMLGINGAVAAGLPRRAGWQIAALAGLAAVVPDWDGLTLVFGASAYDAGHRLWGHNLLACVSAGLLVALFDYRFDLVTRGARLLTKYVRHDIPAEQLEVRQAFSRRMMLLWIVVAVVAALTQLPADMVVSGTDALPDWELQPFWPFSNQSYVFPMVPWGDVGITLVFIAGMFAMVVRRRNTQVIALLTLVGVSTYIAIRGTIVERLQSQ